MRRILIALAFLALGSPALSQVTAPVYKQPGGAVTAAAGVFCLDLSGAYVACGGGGSGGTATAAAPSYTEGATNQPLSLNLTGDMRVIAKIASGSSLSASNFPATVDTNAGAAGASTVRVAIATGGATPLPTGAATSALQGTIISTLGTPFQAGGSIGNTAFQSEGKTASGASLTENPQAGGGRAATALPTAVTDGQKVALMLTKDGKLVAVLGAPEALRVRGAASTTGTGATTLIAAQGAGVTMEINSAQCFRTDTATTALYVTLNDSVSTTVPVPPVTSGAAPIYSTPLLVAANTALTFTPSAAVTTVFCNAQGNQAH